MAAPTVDGAGQVQGCAIRLARLNADGTIPAASATGMFQNAALVKLDAKPDTEKGDEFNIKDACGNLFIAYKARDLIKRITITLSVTAPDPQEWELASGGALLTSTSAGRTFADGVTTSGSAVVTSATAAFTSGDVGRSISGAGIPALATVLSVQSATSITMSANATATASGVSITLGSLSPVVGWQYPQLLTVANPNGVSIEVWSKAIVAGTGYQASGAAGSGQSAYFRWALPRVYLNVSDRTFENKDQAQVLDGYAIENPNWAKGPNKDFTSDGTATGAAVNTGRVMQYIRDASLPSPLQAGYQSTAA